MTGKFGSLYAECAHAIAGHGFSAERGSVQDGLWEAVVDVSPVLLRNVGENELADRLAARNLHWQVTVRITEDSQGFVDQQEIAFAGSPGEIKLWRQWDAEQEEERHA